MEESYYTPLSNDLNCLKVNLWIHPNGSKEQTSLESVNNLHPTKKVFENFKKA